MERINIIIKEVKKAAKYYIANREVLKENARNKYRILSEKERDKKKKYQRGRYHYDTDLNEKRKQYQRNHYASKNINK